MRNFFIFIFFYLVSLSYLVNANAKMYKVGTILEKEIKFSKNFELPLSDGEWQVINRYAYFSYFPFKGNSIVRLENNEIMEFLWVERANLSGESMGIIDGIVKEITFKDKHDGCYERPEYYLIEVYKKGGTHNCLIIRHLETNKELFSPDDPLDNNPQLKKYLKDNSITIPPIMFGSRHSYYSRLIKGEWYLIRYFAHPKMFNSPKLTHFTEDSSEFHKANINRYPEHKIAMDKWISFSAKRHRHIEKLLNARDHHLLNLDKFILKIDIEDSKNEDIKTKLIEDLEKLNELYKSGVITKEEFKQAKEKILN